MAVVTAISPITLIVILNNDTSGSTPSANAAASAGIPND